MARRASTSPAGSSVPAGSSTSSAPAGPPAESPTRSGSSGPGAWSSTASTVESGAGLLLGVLVWGWVILPFIKGGPTRVKDVLRAKFFNKAPDGTWLP